LFSQQTSSTSFTTLSDNESASETLKKGNYTLAVAVAYFTNNKIGAWKEKSKHHFEIEGL
jgi:hypothetical protein